LDSSLLCLILKWTGSSLCANPTTAAKGRLQCSDPSPSSVSFSSCPSSSKRTTEP
jgi:hypothetical protein